MKLPPGTVEFVTGADGSRLRTLWAGSGPSVVLAHGYLLDLTVYNRVFRALVGAGYRAIAFEHRGHGESTAGTDGFDVAALVRDYGAVLEHFAVSDGQLVAHSLGAFLGIVFCLEHGGRARKHLRRLVLLGGNAGAVAKGSLQNRMQIPLLRLGAIQPLWRFRPTGIALVSQLFGPRPDPRFVEATRAILVRQDTRRSLPVLEAMIHRDYYGRLGEIPLETKVLCGMHDRTCPRWHSERLGSELPNASNAWIPDVGHMLMYEAPDAIVGAIVA